MHLIGMGGFAFHLDYLAELLNNFKARMEHSFSHEFMESNGQLADVSRVYQNHIVCEHIGPEETDDCGNDRGND